MIIDFYLDFIFLFCHAGPAFRESRADLSNAALIGLMTFCFVFLSICVHFLWLFNSPGTSTRECVFFQKWEKNVWACAITMAKVNSFILNKKVETIERRKKTKHLPAGPSLFTLQVAPLPPSFFSLTKPFRHLAT